MYCLAQVQRMLHDSKADSLGEAFAAQWFQTQLIGTRIRLDPIDNPWCTDSLMTAMREETALFFMSLLREDRPIDELIGAKFTFMNEELARTLYKLDGILGDQMRRVSLTDPQRGGILGHASILAVTSSHKDTSPVKRGIFVLDTVLGTPPPPPPPNAGQLEEQLQNDEALTFREKLEQHANGTTCQACHATMDPIGFAMENFDYFGRWRKTYRGKKPIDASGEMPDGTQFTGPTGVKEWILNERRTDFLRQVVAKMLAFALGRELQYYDEPAIQRIMARLERDGCRFQSLLHEVVRSYPFQYRKSAGTGIIVMNKPWRISRRTVLKGLGAAVALPALDVMVPARVSGAVESSFPRRMAYFFFPNGIPRGTWYPARVAADGRLLELNEWMSPTRSVPRGNYYPNKYLDAHG